MPRVEELKVALKMGYTIEVLSGVTFKRGKICTDFISKLYKMRKSHPKRTPLNLLCKLLLNSLYGKFKMSPKITEGILETADETSKRDIFPDDYIFINDELNINFYSNSRRP